MDVELITMDRKMAEESLRTYRRHLHRRADDEYRAVAAGLAALAEGRPILSLSAAIRTAGFDHAMRPRLAIARADRRTVSFTWRAGSRVAFFDTARGWRGGYGLQVSVDCGRVHRQTQAVGDHRYGITVRGHALVPMIPPAAREEAGVAAWRDRLHFVLWEVDRWSDMLPVPVRDPFLLRHLGGDAYAVLAAWDLTPLEQMVMMGRAAADDR